MLGWQQQQLCVPAGPALTSLIKQFGKICSHPAWSPAAHCGMNFAGGGACDSTLAVVFRHDTHSVGAAGSTKSLRSFQTVLSVPSTPPNQAIAGERFGSAAKLLYPMPEIKRGQRHVLTCPSNKRDKVPALTMPERAQETLDQLQGSARLQLRCPFTYCASGGQQPRLVARLQDPGVRI